MNYVRWYYTSEMHNDLYYTNYLIVCYDKKIDKVIVTTQKCGQSFLTKQLLNSHLEVLKNNNKDSVKLGSYNIHRFDEAGNPLSEILEQSKCTNLDELFSKDVHFVIREPIERFISGITEIVVHQLKTDGQYYDESMEFFTSDEGQSKIREHLEKTNIQDYLHDPHILPILDFYNSIWKDNYKVIHMNELDSLYDSEKPNSFKNVRNPIYSSWKNDKTHPIHRLVIQFLDIYTKEEIAWQNLKNH